MALLLESFTREEAQLIVEKQMKNVFGISTRFIAANEMPLEFEDNSFAKREILHNHQ